MFSQHQNGKPIMIATRTATIAAREIKQEKLSAEERVERVERMRQRLECGLDLWGDNKGNV